MDLRRSTVVVSVVGVLAVTLYAALAALQILLWTPLAAVPGSTLDDIRADMHAAGESLQEGMTIGILAIGPILALIVAVIAIRSRAHPMVPAMTLLAVLMLGGPGFFLASFGAGMSLADTYYVSAGVTLPGVRSFYLVSVIAAAVLTAGVIFTAYRTRTRSASSAV
ncbi:hypothetical protein [Microbacterium maritypicum]